MSYNPRPPSIICLFCVKPAAEGGGESLLARNCDLTAALPHRDLAARFAAKGGIMHKRSYCDAAVLSAQPDASPPPQLAAAGAAPASPPAPRWAVSWQERTGTQSREEAERCVQWGGGGLWQVSRGGGGLVLQRASA